MKVKRTLAAIAVIAVLLGLLYQNMTIHEELISLKRTLTEMRQPEDAGQAQGALVDQMTGLVEMVEKSRLDTERIHNEILQLANRVDELSVRQSVPDKYYAILKPEEISDGIGGQTDVTLGDQLTTSGFDGEGVGPDTLEYAFHGLDSYEWFAQQLYDLKRASVSEDMQTMQEILQKMNYEGLTVGASISHDHMKGALYAGMYSGARVDYMTALMAFEREEITVEELEQAYEVFVAVREKVVEGVKSAGFVD